MTRGRFITLEGLEGAGKSTALTRVREYLQRQGIDAVMTREPGGTPLGERIRALLLGQSEPPMAPATEALLMFAARSEHLDKRIWPALERGQWVVCDRFTDASYAYQGWGRGLGAERIAALEDWTQGALRPDLTLWLDVPVETGLARAAGRGEAPDRFEQERDGFFERVHEGYAALAERFPERIRRVDAGQPLEAVLTALEEALASAVTRWLSGTEAH
ncbi:dTMP kinase [Alkalilimnicola ehrlichii MLHE-1]|uniref:Thymidylate kinase n=1 Tax=Alkalilimnicola ehrlichii (strain ATCC BAA-1101 / DSM 17681 / MLHE-1) TaxID=187272 RepID=KTHY_ALKEH|nr:dTMP kinase [Alkalilimnicola ehrlichii]Q0A8S2.1 RecName: Full=Thymidylate kinase; AltName: Full=dTMP kinase [Alkalilimnicola ehrlichii MLHE-1]ABI56765.1 thymidylate kinase [Alkalilimnicola ehrlichii MLHE-1]